MTLATGANTIAAVAHTPDGTRIRAENRNQHFSLKSIDCAARRSLLIVRSPSRSVSWFADASARLSCGGVAMVAALRRRTRSVSVITACLAHSSPSTSECARTVMRSRRPAAIRTPCRSPSTRIRIPTCSRRRSPPSRTRSTSARADGERADVQRHDTRSGIPCEGRRHRHRPLQEQHRAPHGHSLARHRVGQRERRHAADTEHRPAGRHVPVQVQGHASGRLLVSPASSLVDEPGVQGHVRHVHRHEHQRGDAAGVRRSPAGIADEDVRAERHHGVQGAAATARPRQTRCAIPRRSTRTGIRADRSR